jgi:hypothetical protein
MMPHTRATIALKKTTRQILTELGRKNQSYDEVIRESISSKNKLDSLESKTHDKKTSDLSNR